MRSKHSVISLLGVQRDDRSSGFCPETQPVSHFWGVVASHLDKKLTSETNCVNRKDIRQNLWSGRSMNSVSSLVGLEGDGRSFGFYTVTLNVSHFWATRASRLDEKLTSANNGAKHKDIQQHVWSMCST